MLAGRSTATPRSAASSSLRCGSSAPILPLPTRWRDDLARFAPRGTLDAVALHWTGDIAAPGAFDGVGQLRRTGVRAGRCGVRRHRSPGSIAATDHDGAIKLDSRALAVHWPHLFAQTLVLDTAKDNCAGVNRPKAMRSGRATVHSPTRMPRAVVSGEYRTLADGPGAVDGICAIFAPRCDPTASLCLPRCRSRRARMDTHQPARRRLERCAPQGLGQSRRFSVRRWQKGQFTATAKAQE